MASPGSVVIQFLVDARKAAGDAADLAKSFGKVDREADSLDATLSGLENELDSIGRETATLKTDMAKAGVGFDSVGDEAEQAADRVRRAARDMADGVNDGATKIDHETDGIRSSMADTGREAGAEMIQNIGEAIGSGTGSITDTIQGTLGGLTNMAASIPGPFGLAFGAVSVAAGVMFASITKEAEATKKRVASMTQSLIDLGETASDAARQAQWDAWISALEEGSSTLDDIADGIRDANIGEGLFKEAVTGSVAAQAQVLTAVDRTIAKIEAQKKEQGGIGVLDAERLRKLKLIRAEVDGGNKSIEDARDALADTALLTGQVTEEAKRWKSSLDKVKTTVAGIYDGLDDLPNTQDIVLRLVGPNGHPINAGNLDRLTGGAVMAPAAMSTRAAPVTVNVHTNTAAVPGSIREVRALLDSHDLRMGRRPGTPRAAAW